jgi:hypothetical protein
MQVAEATCRSARQGPVTIVAIRGCSCSCSCAFDDAACVPGGASLSRNSDGAIQADSLQSLRLRLAGRCRHGIRRNDLYILTHPEFAANALERAAAIDASWSRVPAPEARANATKFFLPDVYRVEAAKRRG